MERILNTLARLEDINAKSRLGMMDNQRIYHTLQQHINVSKEQKHQLNSIISDTESLLTHANYLFEKIRFLMDSAMGMMNIAQNKRLNIFTVLSVVLMPPTVIASIYGMNFEFLPELHWEYGYLFSIIFMIVASITPIIIFKKKGWI
jgi:magnesium transporter